ncbi:MAG: hypothetical protein KC645_16350 [Gemmatimonadetes bacterium]|nr:hypothetical protein [Gemmatimonadota bacterium]
MAAPNVEDLVPLTPMQQLMLLHALAGGDDGLVNQVVYDVGGPVDGSAFALAWTALVARHAALRTGFLWEDLERPVQVVRTAVDAQPARVDLTTEQDPDAAADAWVQQDRAAGFDPRRPPLVRAALVHLAADRHRLVCTVHHLVADRWSYDVLISELGVLYGAARAGSAAGADLPAAPRFRDYVAWMQARDQDGAVAYWRESLDGVAAEAGANRTSTGPRATQERTVDARVLDSLRERARATRTSLGVWMQLALALGLARRMGREDVVFGLTVSGRPPQLPDAERTVGSFVNNVPVRVRLHGLETPAAAAQWLHAEQVRRQRHEHLAPPAIAAAAGIPAGRALYDVLCVLNLDDAALPRWSGLDIRIHSATLDAAVPFLFAVGRAENGLTLRLLHDQAREDEAARLLTDVEDALARLAALDPGSAWIRDWIASVAAVPGTPATSATVGGAPASPGNAASRGDGGATEGRGAETVLLALWREVLGDPTVGLDDDFFALGGTSLQAAHLFAGIERRLGRTLPLSTLLRSGSVRALLRELDQPVSHASPVVRLRSGGTLAPLYVVPGIGGHVVGLAALARALGADQPFYGLESRGLHGERAPLESIEAIAEDFATEVAATGDGPVDLLGLCWGAAVAFEMTERVRARGRPVRTLALLDPAVLLRAEEEEPGTPDGSFLKRRLELYWDELKGSDWRGRGRFLVDKARRAASAVRGDAQAQESRLERDRYRVREANRRAVTRYDPQPLSVRACIFLTPERDLGGEVDPRLEWRTLIDPEPPVVHVPGSNSGDAISAAHAASFASALRAWLREARQPR